jgi:hypothetical protein
LKRQVYGVHLSGLCQLSCGLSDILKHEASSSDMCPEWRVKKSKIVWPSATMELKLRGPAYELYLWILKTLAFQDTKA